MLNNQMIAPELAFAHCGMFIDSEEAFLKSMAWYEAHKNDVAEQPTSTPDNNTGLLTEK
jgi:hypothetical protein